MNRQQIITKIIYATRKKIMPLLSFITLLVMFITALKKKNLLANYFFGAFVTLWVAIFIPHIIHYINIQL